MNWTIDRLKYARESEDKVEFKKGEHGNVAYDGGSKVKPSDRRRCILGYVTALCNENGGTLVIGMEDHYPHAVVGTSQCINAIGNLEAKILVATGTGSGMRYSISEGFKAETKLIDEALEIGMKTLARRKMSKNVQDESQKKFVEGDLFEDIVQ